ncbi:MULTISPECIES: iron-hydroxamate ABC transporter substrate-binding protein [Bacillus cereus group]|uniref:iron-hydroxamate ABC transporter substrate-binding protein n=1 Tax=Bacillus cereus group TaxID=86661 RepID=UPI000872AE6B|nr:MULTISPECIES: iron-hydroxamate ABC transporter substrate-binding protein [Bacillus cereus group]OFC97256.1 putative siderophore-binding lipoprotein YfiY [Bacillus thuringiensis]MBJ8045338.1 iron-hydroxamate ABC transporter substrate-binding protein [Bacillus cereus group sp. N18]OFD05626.1 putative siderophore-binding lipoprotein YfiY [Bacillus thuringiensis]PDZ82050.1 ferrichrome ABC transporter substrate-binding protein [Bacillus toyonensis]PEA72092.1 ferrichrome ABC transporter substrate
MKRKLFILLTIMLVVLSIVGCSSQKEASKAKEQPKTKIVKHAKGEATIPVNPKRIVDLSGSTEELLLLGHKPVGTANTYKDKIQNHLTDKLDGVKAVGWYWAPKVDLEAVTALKPDLIILNNRQLKIYDQLEKVAPTVVLETNLEDWRGKFKEVGKLFDEEKKADKWIADYDKKADSLSKKIKEKTKDENFMFVAVTPQNFRVYGSFGYGDIIFNDLKLPATKGTDLKQTMAQVSLEGLVAFQPDQMFIVNFGGEADKVYEDYKNSAVWKDNKAVKNNHVYEVSNEIFNTKAFNPIGKDMLIDEIAKEILAKNK